jgi:hypothetical protein
VAAVEALREGQKNVEKKAYFTHNHLALIVPPRIFPPQKLSSRQYLM